MPRPVFVFDRGGWLDVHDEDGGAVSYEWIDVEADEYIAFDIDGQVLSIVPAADPDPAGAYRFAPTGHFDVASLFRLAARTPLWQDAHLADDPLLELANAVQRSEWIVPKPERRRWLRGRDRPTPPPAPLVPFTRS
jgi:hypothetical protein